MGLRVGDKIYCHTTGHMNHDPSQPVFAYKGKYYEIMSAGYDFMDDYYIWIIDEQGMEHRWPLDELFYNYFSIGEPMEPKKLLTKFEFG